MNQLVQYQQIIIIMLITLNMNCNSKRQFDSKCEQIPKYYKEFKVPEKIIGYNNYEQAFNCAKKTNKQMAVYFTSTICKNCQEFESEFLNLLEVSELLNENFVFVELFVDDKTELPKEDQFIETNYFTGKKRRIKNIGHLNCTLLSKYNHSSHPALFLTNKNDSILSLINYDTNIDRLLDELKSTIEK